MRLKGTVFLCIEQLSRPKKRQHQYSRNGQPVHELQVQHKLNKVHRENERERQTYFSAIT